MKSNGTTSSSNVSAVSSSSTVAASDPRPLDRWQRVGASISGLIVLALLIIASTLEPNPEGFGTHQQLGLPPCTSVVLFGWRCPACGMTTSWALLLHGRIVEALATNVAGVAFALIAIAYLPASCYFTLVGRATQGAWFSLALGISLLASMAIAAVQWLGRMLV